MSVQQDRMTFFGVLIAVVVVVIGYLQLGQMYPVAGRADAPNAVPNGEQVLDQDENEINPKQIENKRDAAGRTDKANQGQSDP